MTTHVADSRELDELFDAYADVRRRTFALVDPIAEDDLVRVHSPLMSPLVWDLGHIAAFEDLWLVHRFGGRPMVRGQLAAVYDAFETPRADRGDLPFLGPEEARAYMSEVREQALELARQRGIGDGRLHEMVLRHEHQHCETMMQTIQLARLEGYAGIPRDRKGRADGAGSATGLEFVEVQAGPCSIGAPQGFSYDNERPRHRVELDTFEIGRVPVTNGAFLEFVTAGGYERREWWSDEGWAWRLRDRVDRPGGWSRDLRSEWRLSAEEELDPERPVTHVSWFEADAFARARGARLPSEFEWEKAASWDRLAARPRVYPWGDEPPVPGRHANVDQRQHGPTPADQHHRGVSPYGCEDMLGQVWEWTASTFSGYPGFEAHPYKEYSEVFFGDSYRVLRGGSWATRARVASAAFRNWDFPQRRQIFSGFRLAR